MGLSKAIKTCRTDRVHPLLESAFEFYRKFIKKLGPPSEEAALERHEGWRRFRVDLLAFFQRYDAIVCPPDTEPAWKHGTSFQWEDARGFEYAGAFNMSGSPAAVVRCGTSPDGMPIGVQVVGPHWREDIVLAIAGFLEREFGGWQPPNL